MLQSINNIKIPESMKTPTFRFTAVGLLLFTAVIYPILLVDGKNDDLKTYSAFYHLSVCVVWNLAAFAALLSCEWKIQRVLFVRHVRERCLRLQPESNAKMTPEEEDQPISFDAMMLVPYTYGMIATFDSITRTAMVEKSIERDVATIVARASFIMCCYAIYGDMLCRRDDRTGIYVHPADLRMIAWFVLMAISFLACAFGLVMGNKFY
jgi:hypothetical protein